MISPRPGATFLFIGGVCDGERKVVSDPLDQIEAFCFMDCKEWARNTRLNFDDVKPNTLTTSLYRLRRIISGERTMFYYAEQSMTDHDAVMAMARGYRGKADGGA